MKTAKGVSPRYSRLNGRGVNGKEGENALCFALQKGIEQ